MQFQFFQQWWALKDYANRRGIQIIGDIPIYVSPDSADVWAQRANDCIIPIKDWLGCDNSCRMNVPSTVGQNWRWRLRGDELTAELQNEILGMTRRFGRMNWDIP